LIALSGALSALGLQAAGSGAYAQQGSKSQTTQSRTASKPGRMQPGQAQGPIHVYLLRGFMNVFSLGMDDLAAKLQAAGIAATVVNHADSDFVASRIMSTYNSGDHGPIVLIGHSLGADAVADIATTLARYNVPVALAVMFDGTEAHQIPGNVTTAINYTRHFMITGTPGARTAVSNVDLSTDPAIDHLNIDKSPALQSQTMNYIMQTAAPLPATARRQ
jgi:hypothetical protein